ncbi:branched-chain amino acid transport system II carrier protein, partial [Staphylococcus hominis]|uniref:branched-chain amino acid transport system II carrier protein n=1 Tax=Staphylococcus hominis TaxID=1290 RepID=UPI001643830F
PFLGIIPIPISNTNALFQISSPLTKIYPYIFTIPLYLLIPPFFPLPTLPTTSYQIAFSPFLSPTTPKSILPLF